GVAEDEGKVSRPVGEGVLDERLAGGRPVDTHRVRSVAVEGADEGDVSRRSELERELGGAQTAAVGAELVDDVEALLRRAIDGDGVIPVPVEVSGQGDVPGIAEIEGDVGHALGVGIAQIDVAVRAPIEAQGLLAIAVPVTREWRVTGVSVEEGRNGRVVTQLVPEVEATAPILEGHTITVPVGTAGGAADPEVGVVGEGRADPGRLVPHVNRHADPELAL